MSQDPFSGPKAPPEIGKPRSLRHVRAAQLRARHEEQADLRVVGALAYALSPQRHSDMSRTWMAFLLVLSTVNVGLGLRTFARVRRRATRYWPIATAAWGILSTVVVRILMRI